MTDEKELHTLARLMQATGATVEVAYDSEGYIDTIRIDQAVPKAGNRSIGPHPMGPIAAAERMRAYLNA